MADEHQNDAQVGERPTEDDFAQAALGGTRGSKQLPDQKMTPQRAKKTTGLTPDAAPDEATDRLAKEKAATTSVDAEDLK